MAADLTGREAVVMADTNSKRDKILLVELKNGRVTFKQKPLSLEKLSETLQEIVKFREMLTLCVKRGDAPLIEIPDEHKPVVAKLIHESDKTLAALSKYIHTELLPALDDDNNSDATSITSILPLQAVEACIKSIAVRNNYGLDGAGIGKVSASFYVWRWEVNQEYYKWLPKNVQEKIEVRLADRVQAKKDLLAQFQAFTQEERDHILNPKGKVVPRKRKAITPGESIVDMSKDPKNSSTQSIVQQQHHHHHNDHSLTKPDRTGKPNETGQSSDFEKSVKDKENESTKNKVGRPKKEKRENEDHVKSRSIMANFLGKYVKPNQLSRSAQHPSDPLSSNASDFAKTFKPFLLKKDAELAAPNWFISRKTHRSGVNPKNAIVIEDENSQKILEAAQGLDDHSVDVDTADMSSRERLLSILSSLPSPPAAFPSRQGTHPPTVRDVMTKLSEAEISGDVSRVRSLLDKLQNRALFVSKVLSFREDTRPGYFGTWTRVSAHIGPRRPLKRDPVAIDYSYDSGEDWEDEASGDGDDVVDDADDDGGSEESDSDLDGWLVDDDDEIEMVTPLEEDRDPLHSNFVRTPRPTAPKRKSDDECQRLGKKRKVVVPLVPFAKGPCWESTLGQCESDLFKRYRVQLFNDTPFPIDPFTFVSAEVKDRRSTTVFAVPALPDRLAESATSGATLTSDSSASHTAISLASATLTSANPSVRRNVSAPKTSFPDIYLPQLLAKINSFKTGNFVFLVESIYQELRGFGVKKNAIEAKLKEIGEKSKEKRIWIVKNGGTVVPSERTR